MPHSKKRLEQLRAEFPFLNDLLALHLRPLAAPDAKKQIDQLDIKVERADASLMYQRGENVGLGADSRDCLLSIRKVSGEEFGVSARQGEYLFAVPKDGGRMSKRYWPVDDRPGESPVYARSIFNVIDVRQVKYLVWVTVRTWYRRGMSDYPFGSYIDRSVRVTIYNPPALGFEHLLRTATLGDSYLTSRELLRGVVNKDPEWTAVSNELQAICRTFNDQVYRSGMKPLMDACNTRGMSGEFGGIALRSWIAAGRVMVTVEEDGKCYLSFAGIEEDPELGGWQGLSGSMPAIRSMMERVVAAWKATADTATTFVADRKVTMFPGF